MGGVEVQAVQRHLGAAQDVVREAGEDGVALLEEGVEGAAKAVVVELVGRDVLLCRTVAEDLAVLGHGSEVALTPTEFDLLALLAQSPGRVFTREILMNKVWGYDYLGDGHTIDVHISALRKKIEANSERRYITTVWRVGYRFEVKTRTTVP